MDLYDEDNMLMLSGIQHYMFCPRQWALIHIEQQWAEPICSQIYYFCKLIINRLSTIESHPLWVRGLKLEVILHQQVESRSHPLWVRGLKLRWAMVKALRTDIAHFVGVD